MLRTEINLLRKYKSSINKKAKHEMFDIFCEGKKQAFKYAKRQNKFYRKLINHLKIKDRN